jgi:hypothetical protein
MSPQQATFYLSGQVAQLSADVTALLKVASEEQRKREWTRIHASVEHLKGYALALEHLGYIPKSDADSIFAVFDFAQNFTPKN